MAVKGHQGTSILYDPNRVREAVQIERLGSSGTSSVPSRGIRESQ